jgi:hypothetical protein
MTVTGAGQRSLSVMEDQQDRLSCCTLLPHRLSLKRQGLTLEWVDPSLERHGVVVQECMWPI